MLFKFMRNITLLFCFSLIATLSYAEDKLVPCPNVNLIRYTADNINQAFRNGENKLYTASTTYPVIFENGFAWVVAVDRIFANSATEAILIGKNQLHSATYSRTKFAHSAIDGLTCMYGPAEIMAVSLR